MMEHLKIDEASYKIRVWWNEGYVLSMMRMISREVVISTRISGQGFHTARNSNEQVLFGLYVSSYSEEQFTLVLVCNQTEYNELRGLVHD